MIGMVTQDTLFKSTTFYNLIQGISFHNDLTRIVNLLWARGSHSRRPNKRPANSEADRRDNDAPVELIMVHRVLSISKGKPSYSEPIRTELR